MANHSQQRRCKDNATIQTVRGPLGPAARLNLVGHSTHAPFGVAGDEARAKIEAWRTDYTVILENDRVTQYGPGQVRQEGPHLQIVVPVK